MKYRQLFETARGASGLLVAVILIFAALSAKSAISSSETPHLAFVMEYVRELAALERLRLSALSELKTVRNNSEQLSDGINWSSRTQIELRLDIRMLTAMHLEAPYDTLIPALIDVDQQKIELHKKLIAISTEFLAGPKPGVNYGVLAAEVPKIRAQLGAADGTLLTISTLAFASLIDDKPDSRNHMSRLTITKAEKIELLTQIRVAFGTELAAKNPGDLVNAAWVLRSYLSKEKGYKCADEV